MRKASGAAVLASLLLGLLPAAAARAAPPTITPNCTPGPSNCSGWYTAPSITLTWSISNVSEIGECLGGTVSSDTAGITFSCTASNPDGTTIRTVTIKRDATPPTVTGATGSRAPDANGWYNQPFSLSFGGTDATSGIASCTAAAYAGPDTSGGSLSGTCTDVAGNTSSPGSATFRYDATAPEVTGVSFARPPDSADWYTKPVALAFAGADATSGVESCTAVEYGGPDGDASVSGSCRDRAGNLSGERTASFRYDATAPEAPVVATERGRGFVLLRWRTSVDTAGVELARSPGTRSRPETTLYRGRATSFRDRSVARNRRYRYVLTALDAAGNRASRTVPVFVRPALYRPAPGARVGAPPLLAWEADPRASYYNVQLFRGAQKILTRWPAAPRLRLSRSWTYAGTAQRLDPGRYRWYVWPGYGPRARSRYGKLIGSSAFVLTR